MHRGGGGSEMGNGCLHPSHLQLHPLVVVVGGVCNREGVVEVGGIHMDHPSPWGEEEGEGPSAEQDEAVQRMGEEAVVHHFAD